MLHLIDSHCHLDFNCFDADRTTILQSCAKAGIKTIVVPGVTTDNVQRLVDLKATSPLIEIAFGCHPMLMNVHAEASVAVAALSASVQQHQPIAIGEIGLDFYQPTSSAEKKAQLNLFEAQLDLAQQVGLPVILHVRKAHDEVLKLLRQKQLKGGIVHAFSGSLQQAEIYAGLGFLVGIGGALTYPRAQRLQKLFKTLPLTQIVLETDAPDMPLCGQQGQRNTPENLSLILDTLAELRQETKQQVAAVTTDNCRQLFAI